MKKITGFFLAILPLFITILLFATGFIVKQGKHIDVTDVRFASESYVIQKTDDKEMEEDLGYSVTPKNATNPDVVFHTAEGGENVVQVDATGMATIKDWGETTVYIYSRENPTINSKASIKVTDDKYHRFEVKNHTNAEYLGYNQEIKLDVAPYPSATDVKHDPTIKFYSTDESVVEVAADGTLKAKDKDGTATIYIYNEPSGAYTPFEVRVSKGVYLVDFDNPSDTVVASKSIDLSKELITYPDTTIASKPTEFEWSSSNEEIAKVDENGKATFLQPGEVTFTAAYKRNPYLVFTYKKIKSTCTDLYDVNFNNYNYVGTTATEYADITCQTFPANDQSQLIVESSDESVVKPELVDNIYKFKIVGTGKAMLTATFVGAIGAEPVTDSCSITIRDKEGTSLILKDSLTTDSYYYSLRDNVNLNSFDPITQSITWTKDDEEGIASLDDTNGIVHFTKAGFIDITATVGSKSATFTLICTGKDSKKLDIQDEIHIKVGTKYTFGEDYSLYSGFDKFDVVDTYYFIPKCGGTFDVTLHGGFLEYKYVTLVVEENPIAINYETTAQPYLATAETEYAFKDNVLKSSPIIPSTATKADGTKYEVKCEYEADEEVATVEDDTITFKKAGEVKVKVSLGSTNITDTFVVKSTNGNTGKFYLNKGTDKIYSGNTINLDAGTSVTLELDSTLAGTAPTQEMYDEINKNISDPETKALWEKTATISCAFDSTNEKIIFTITGVAYGQAQILIPNKTFSFTLNVNVSTKISNFYLYYQGSLLSKEENNTFFVNDDVKLNVILSPISSAKVEELHTKYTVKLDEETLTVKEDDPLTIDLSGKLSGTHTLTLTSTDDPQITASFNIVYKDTIEAADFDLEGTSEKTGYDGQVFMPATDTQSVQTITLKGFANDAFYERFSSTGNEVKLGRVIINGITAPTIETPGYEKDFDLIYVDGEGTSITKKYHLTREIVSRIAFPGHDNWDETDAKGLQKVHVYGDLSWFDDKQTEVANFYRLPINLYDFQGKLIKDTLEEAETEGSIKVTKEDAYKTLVPNCSDDATTVKYATPDDYSKEGYIQLGFSNACKYSFLEMYNNEFANKQNKNVTFTLGTHNYETYADYTFVVTGGVNAYCQKALSGAVTNKNWGIILQTNFGKEGAEKDNVPYTQPNNWLPNLFGNGYTLNLNCAEKQWGPSKTALIYSLRQMNIVLQGCNQSTMTHDNHISLCPRHEWHEVGDKNCYMAYCEIKCFPEGVDYNNDDAEHHIKNCVFHHNLDYSIKAMTSKVTVDIEDCVFYNCGSFAVFAWDFPTVRFKGMIDVYNFHNKEMLENIQGFDLSFAWNTVLEVARSQQVVQIGADGRDYINSFMAGVLAKNFYFWNPETGAYEKSDNGFTGNGEYIYKYGDVSLPFIGGIKLWGTQIPKIKPHAPDYYEMYDQDGKIKPEFVAAELAKITRTRSIWELRILW